MIYRSNNIACLFKHRSKTILFVIIAVGLLMSLYNPSIVTAQDPSTTPGATTTPDHPVTGTPEPEDGPVGLNGEQGESPQSVVDSDRDGLSDSQEEEGWTITVDFTQIKVTSNPKKEDTDGDGLTDKEEYDGLKSGSSANANATKTNPSNPDTDGDELNDFTETEGWLITVNGKPIKVFPDPLKQDTDDDGLTDRQEIIVYSTDPTLDDTDGDGLLDKQETEGALYKLFDKISGITITTSPTVVDTDGDGLSDFKEQEGGCNPKLKLANSNDVHQCGGTDTDLDWLSDSYELVNGTDPNNIDTDNDGIEDGYELFEYKTNPLKADTDGDGLSDNKEIESGTDPNNIDTGNDGLGDRTGGGPQSKVVEKSPDLATLKEIERVDGVNDYAHRSSNDTVPQAVVRSAGANDPDVGLTLLEDGSSETTPGKESGITLLSIIVISALFLGIVAIVVGIIVWMKVRSPNTTPIQPHTIRPARGQYGENPERGIVSALTKVISSIRTDVRGSTENGPLRISQSFRQANMTAYDSNSQRLLDDLAALFATLENHIDAIYKSQSDLRRQVDELNNAIESEDRANRDADVEADELEKQIDRLERACISDIPDSSQRRIPLGILRVCSEFLNSSGSGESKIIAVQNVNSLLELLYSWYFPNRRP